MRSTAILAAVLVLTAGLTACAGHGRPQSASTASGSVRSTASGSRSRAAGHGLTDGLELCASAAGEPSADAVDADWGRPCPAQAVKPAVSTRTA
ncbi:MAG: hypothetical protein ACFNZX_03445, partial [Actinomyces sp.]